MRMCSENDETEDVFKIGLTTFQSFLFSESVNSIRFTFYEYVFLLNGENEEGLGKIARSHLIKYHLKFYPSLSSFRSLSFCFWEHYLCNEIQVESIKGF